jgi:hypothetical protein
MQPSEGKMVGLPEISAGLAVGRNGVKVAASLRRFYRRRRNDDAIVKQAKLLLGIGEADLFAYRAAALHPLYDRGLPHPDDRAALISVSGDEYRRAVRESELETVERLAMSLSDGMVLVGSPEAEGIARLAFGYRRRKDDQGMEFRRCPIDLPFRWEEDASQVQATCRRFVPEKRGVVERPNWPLVDQRGSRDRRLYPRVRNDGLLDTDLLLITKVPNFLTPIGYESGRSLISFAGTHGTATRAVDLLLNDRSQLRLIAERLDGDPAAFQIVVEAGKIIHSYGKGSRASSVRVKEIVPFEATEDAWRAGTRIVEQEYGSWLREISS